MVQKSNTVPLAFCGRRLSAAEIELIREVVSDFRALSLTEIARTICELLEWKRPNGRLKNHECRLLLEKLSVAGLVNLPPLRASGPRGRRVVTFTENGEAQELLNKQKDVSRMLLAEGLTASLQQAYKQPTIGSSARHQVVPLPQLA